MRSRPEHVNASKLGKNIRNGKIDTVPHINMKTVQQMPLRSGNVPNRRANGNPPLSPDKPRDDVCGAVWKVAHGAPPKGDSVSPALSSNAA